jgi:hypothetical protein
MGFKKSEKRYEEIRVFDTFLDAQKVFEDRNANSTDRLNAIEYIVEHQEIYYVLNMLSHLFKENKVDENKYIDAAFLGFKTKPKREKDFEAMFKMLKSDNAYLRNAVISFLQDYGKEAKEFILKLMEDEDKDIRIFAINILGDVRYEDSADMLRHFIAKENDINALMTAVDYMGEIGEKDDIELLETIKKERNDEYVKFGIDMAISRIKGGL